MPPKRYFDADAGGDSSEDEQAAGPSTAVNPRAKHEHKRPRQDSKPERATVPQDKDASRSLLIQGLPVGKEDGDKEDWAKILRVRSKKWVNLDKITLQEVGGQPGALVICATPRDAHALQQRLHNHVVKDRLLNVGLKSTHDLVTRLGRAKGGGRLIVRNLGFDVTREDLLTVFAPFGALHSIDIPLSPSGRGGRGFAFVYFLSHAHGEKALEKINGTKIYNGMLAERAATEGGKEGKKKEIRLKKKAALAAAAAEAAEGEQTAATAAVGGGGGEKGRVVSVDWALGKDAFEKAGKEAPVVVEPEAAAEAADNDEDDSSEDEEEDNEEADDAEQSEDEAALESEDDEELAAVAESSNKGKASEEEGTTLFVRNISFETTETELYELFKSFGPVRYARIVFDPETKRSRGTAFVCFWKHESAMEVLQASEELNAGLYSGPTSSKEKDAAKGGKKDKKSLLSADPSSSLTHALSLHGRVLAAVPALSKGESDTLRLDRDRASSATDRRNLYLMREGVIFPSTPAAASVAPTEMQARQSSYEARKGLLRSNPSLFVSKTRLSVRQIPLWVTDAMLKRLAKHAVRAFDQEVKKGERKALEKEEKMDATLPNAGAGKAIRKDRAGKVIPASNVQQAKILRVVDRVDALTGLGRSKGYGFLEMSTHGEALKVIRWAGMNTSGEVGKLFRSWWKDELERLLAGTMRSSKADKERREKIEERLAELEKDAKEHEESQKEKKVARIDPKALEKKGKGLIIEFSIENALTTKRRKERIERARLRGKGVAVPEPAGKTASKKRKGAPAAADEDKEEAEPSPKKKKREEREKNPNWNKKSEKKVAAAEDGKVAKAKEDRDGLSVGSIIGKKRKEKKTK